MPLIRSRIHQFINKELMSELKAICLDVTISDNNTKVKLIKEALTKHNVPYNDLGPGTNRMAVLIDGYVFKIAMDKWGVRDNDNEFAMSEILQPYVINVYETNGLISVSEYVTLISKEEFAERKDEIMKILHTLSQGFLLGDVGYVPKNFANWGYRTDGQLVILDFAYIYRIIGDELLCSNDGHLLQYDEYFHNLRCPYCKKRYKFTDVRRKVTRETEDKEIKSAKESAYALTTPSAFFADEQDEEELEVKEEQNMDRERDLTEEERDELYDSIADLFDKPIKPSEMKKEEPKQTIPEESEDDPLDDVVSLMEKVYHEDELEENEPQNRWSGTKLIRKEGSIPENVNDGDLLIDSKERNAYATEGFIDNNLPEGKTFYYKLFPYDELEENELQEEEECEDEQPFVNPLETFLIANGVDPETGDDLEQQADIELVQSEEVTVKTNIGIREALIIEHSVDEEKSEEVQQELNVEQVEETVTVEEPKDFIPEEVIEEQSEVVETLNEEKQKEENNNEGVIEVTVKETTTVKSSIRRLTKGEHLKSEQQITQNEIKQAEDETTATIIEEEMEDMTMLEDEEVKDITTEEYDEEVESFDENDLFTASIRAAQNMLEYDDEFEQDDEDIEDEMDKYERLAEEHLGRDPYDY